MQIQKFFFLKGEICLLNRTTIRLDFLTHLWSVCKLLLFDTQNPEISRFSTAHAYKYKTKRQAKIKAETKKNDIFVD